MVFLAGIVPAGGMTLLEQQMREKDMVLIGADAKERSSSDARMSWEEAHHYFYHDLDEPLARSAWQLLRRQSLTVLTKPYPLAEWPEVPTTSIVMAEDHAMNPVWSRRYATEVLGADLIELPGSHSPFYSRPGELVAVLTGL